MFDVGTIIAGRYELLAALGGGGSGVVYSALDRATEKHVAAKLLGRRVLDERNARARLKLEACISGRVSSEHVVQVMDVGIDTATGVPYLIMELLDGKDLQQLVESQGVLEPALVVEYLRQIALGLDKAHRWQDSDGRAAPIVHRDLKPSNLFLTFREDGNPHLKILDFGLAKVLAQSATLSGEPRGTPLYMAPEQLAGAPLSPATDVWALALVAFFLLTGMTYWRMSQGSDVALEAVLKEVGEGPTDPPSSRLKEFGIRHDAISRQFDKWFLRCAHIDPQQRFRSAGEAVCALAIALNVPLHQPALPSEAPLARSIARTWFFSCAVGVAAGTLGWVVVSSVSPRTPHFEAKPALPGVPQPRLAAVSDTILKVPGEASVHPSPMPAVAIHNAMPSDLVDTRTPPPQNEVVSVRLHAAASTSRSKPKPEQKSPDVTPRRNGTIPSGPPLAATVVTPEHSIDPALRAKLEDPLAHR